MNILELTTNDFDYSLLDAKTKEFLEERANIIYGIQSKSAYEIGKQLAKAQKELSTRGYGCFEEWYRSLGFKKTKAYEYINHYNFVCSQNEQTNIEKFESLPKVLQAQVAKPSANPEVNQAVFNGDIKTHKEYKELERRLKLKDQALEAVKGELERVKQTKSKEKVIEKEVIKEVVPEDYQFFKSNYEASERNNEFYKQQNSELREEMKELERIIKEQQKNKASREELSDLEERKRAISFELDSLEKIVALNEAVESFLKAHASLQYSSDFSNLYNNRDLTLSLLDTINRLEKWIDDIKSELPKSEIIEGE